MRQRARPDRSAEGPRTRGPLSPAPKSAAAIRVEAIGMIALAVMPNSAPSMAATFIMRASRSSRLRSRAIPAARTRRPPRTPKPTVVTGVLHRREARSDNVKSSVKVVLSADSKAAVEYSANGAEAMLPAFATTMSGLPNSLSARSTASAPPGSVLASLVQGTARPPAPTIARIPLARNRNCHPPDRIRCRAQPPAHLDGRVRARNPCPALGRCRSLSLPDW